MSEKSSEGWFSGLGSWGRRDSRPVEGAEAGADLTDGEGSAGDMSAVASEPVDDDSDPVHNVLKRTDVWFAYRVGELEREAKELASIHAEKGQPRHDLERNGPLEMEIILEKHGSEILSNWMDRVRRKMQGAVEAETERIGIGLASARSAVANAEAAAGAYEDAVREANVSIRALHIFRPEEAVTTQGQSPEDANEVVVCERQVGTFMFFACAALLILADFLANVPVFVELFPANGMVDAALVRWEQTQLARGLSASFGVRHLFARVTTYPEPSLLALSVIVFFLVLGHYFGSLLRTLVALWPHRRRAVSRPGATRWRQAFWPAGLAMLGMGLVVGVLFFARASVLPMAQSRFQQAESNYSASVEKLTAAETAGTTGVELDILIRGRTKAIGDVTTRRERLDYASTLSGMNFAITLLNVVLAIAAIVLGYLHREERISVAPEAASDREEKRREREAQLREKELALRERLQQVWTDLTSRRGHAHEALRSVEIAQHRVAHLLEARVLTDWGGKADRVRRAVPVFRTENARLRGLDIEDIGAFRSEFAMELPRPQSDRVALDRPNVLEQYEQEMETLVQRLHGLDQKVPKNAPEPHISTAA